MNQPKPLFAISLRYVFTTLIAVFFTWLLHEFAHWLAGTILGNEMAMTLNASYPTGGGYLHKEHDNIVSAAGPIITVIQAIVFYLLLKRKKDIFLFPFLFACFYMRLLAGVLNIINLNDEGRISKDLGLGVYTVPVVVAAFLFYLVYDTAKSKGYTGRFIAWNVLLVMIASSVLILADQALKLRIL